MAETEPMWAELVQRWVHHLEGEDRSPHTIRGYRDDVEAFASWYRGQHDAEPGLGSLIKRDLADWRAELEAQPGRGGGRGAVATVARKLSALRSLFRWAQAQDLGVRFEPPVPPRRAGRVDPRWLTPGEERGLIAAFEVADRPRDLAILYLGLHAGLRLMEMQALDWGDVEVSERKGRLRVRGKGRKERFVPLNKTLRHALLDLGGGKVPKAGPVLTGQRGRLSARGLQDIVDRYARAAKVGKARGLKGFSHHALRHTFARRMVDAGVPIVDIAALLGHADVKTTMVYLTSKDENLAKAVEKLDGAG